MKKKLYLLFMLICMHSYGKNGTETVIKFWKKEGKIEHDYKDTKLDVPIRLVFNQSDFTNDLIEIVNNSGFTIGSDKFGSTTFNPDPDKVYSVKIQDKNGKSIIFPLTEDGPTSKDVISIELQINGDSITTIKYLSETNSDPKEGEGKGKDKEPSYQAGYLYYDVMALLADNLKPVEKLKILSAYGYHGEETNQYLKSLYEDLDKKAGAHSATQALLNSVGGMDVTNFAAGLSRFLAERAKEELNDAFFKKMKEQLNVYPELKTVFPQTTHILNTIENYSYSSVLPILKERFEMDIRDLPENLYSIKDLTKSNCTSGKPCDKTGKCKDISKHKGCEQCRCEERLDTISTFFKSLDGQWLAVGLFTVKEAFKSGNPANLLSSIASSDDLKKVKGSSQSTSKLDSYNVVSSIELMDFISQSLISKEEKQVWINSSEFNALFKTKDAFQIYLGLLLALQDKTPTQIEFYKTDNQLISVGTILRNAYSAQDELKTFIKGAYTGFNAANLAVKNIVSTNLSSGEPAPQAMYDYYKIVTSSLKQIINDPLIKKITRDISAEYFKIERYLDPAVDMAYHISTKKYSSAIYDAVELLNNIPGFEDKIGKPFIKYGTLISTVASAQSSDEVKKAIEASVLPAGSSAVKRKSAWSISVNAYVGLYYGWAHSKSIDTSFNSATNTLDTTTRSTVNGTYGLYAPIGLSFNRGFRCGHKRTNYWGITLSTQLLDVGALVNFYATKGDGASLPTDFKVRLSDILSPGLQLGVNIPGPITIMGGFQYVPALNKVSQVASSSTLSPIAWRVQVGIVVDIPLYHLKVWDFRK